MAASGTTRPPRRSPASADLRGRLAVLTGASSGIGVETARGLAHRGRRRRARCARPGRRARRSRASSRPTPPASSASCRSTCATSTRSPRSPTRSTGPVDLLIANAGVSKTPDAHLANGLDVRFATNHLGHFLLALRLQAPDGRARRADRGGELRRAQGRAGPPRRSPVAVARARRGPGVRGVEERQHPVRAGGDAAVERRGDLRQRGAAGIGADRTAAVPRRRAQAPDRLHPARRHA